MSKRATLESEIQRRILAEIGAEPDYTVFKNAVGIATNYDGEGKPRKHPFGLGVGSPDLVGILHFGQCVGCWVCMEVKVPGEDAEPHQTAVHEQWRAMGALVYVVHSSDEGRMALATARLAIETSLRAWAAEGCP